MSIKTYVGFISANRLLMKEYENEIEDLMSGIVSGSLLLNTPSLQKKIEEDFSDIIGRYFTAGSEASINLVDREVVALSNTLEVPFKYNKDVIDLVDENSVFRGYRDELYRQGFTRQEIRRVERVLLTGTYNNTQEEAIRDELLKTRNMTRRRAQLLARSETSRLRNTTNKVYFMQSDVQRQYDLVWDAVNDENVRPDHLALDGQKANNKGEFISPKFGTIISPPISRQFGCRCSTKFVKK